MTAAAADAPTTSSLDPVPQEISAPIEARFRRFRHSTSNCNAGVNTSSADLRELIAAF